MEQSVKISSGKVAYWTHGDASKPALLMVHGFTGDHYGFDKMVALLKDDYFIITPDLPGSGISDLQQKRDWTIDGLARLTNEFVATLKLPKPPVLLGHSMGGLVASSMISQSPNIFAQKSILLSPVPTKIRFLDSRWIGAQLTDLQYFAGHYLPVAGPAIIKSRWLTKFIASLLITTKDQSLIKFTQDQMLNNLNYISSIQYYFLLSRDINRRGALNYAEGLAKKDLLVINGDKDRVVPLSELEKLIKASGAHLTLIEGVGHDIHYEKPSEAVTAIKTFLNN